MSDLPAKSKIDPQVILGVVVLLCSQVGSYFLTREQLIVEVATIQQQVSTHERTIVDMQRRMDSDLPTRIDLQHEIDRLRSENDALRDDKIGDKILILRAEVDRLRGTETDPLRRPKKEMLK